ncbi:MAG: TonB-dependent receptor [Pseudomonadales bacterium]|nr:TonB-dependent receptor [Pseudomonadales bacterium]
MPSFPVKLCLFVLCFGLYGLNVFAQTKEGEEEFGIEREAETEEREAETEERLADKSHVERSALEEVLVTATRTGETRLQRTPMAITAFDQSQLSAANIDKIKDLSFFVPNLIISQNAAWGQIFIRGVGTNNIFIGGDPSSTIHVDGVYIARPAMVFTDYLNLQQVEVLRGPQGTLYGRNATGGTINYITKKPDENTEFMATVEGGSFNKQNINAYANLAINSQFSANLALTTHQRDGYVDGLNPAGPENHLGEDYDSGRLGLRYLASDSLEVLFNVDVLDRDQASFQYKNSLTYIDGTPVLTPVVVINDFWALNTPHEGGLIQDVKGGNITANVAINEQWAFTSITAKRQFDMFTFGDIDYTEVANRFSNVKEAQEQLSQELVLKLINTQLSLVSGLYYFEEQNKMNFWAQLETERDALMLENFTTFIDGESETQAAAAYVDMTYHLSEKIDIIAGSRYSWEEKTFSSVGHLDKGGVIIPTVNNDDQKNWNRFTPRIGINYFIDSDTMTFMLISTGFKSGGFNFFNLAQGKASFEPETISALEFGIKSELLQHRLRINASIFYNQYEDLQVQQFFAADADSPPSSVIENAAAATIQGLEVELNAFISHFWDVAASLAWLDARYDDFSTARTSAPNDDIDVSNNLLNNAPEYSLSLINNFRHGLAGGELRYRLEIKWQDTVYFTQFNDTQTSQQAYTLVNANMTWASPGASWSLMLYGKNLGNEAYITGIQDISFTAAGKGGAVAGAINEPRTYGLKLAYHYQ